MADSLPAVAVVPVGEASAAAVAWRQAGRTHATAIVKATFAFAIDAEMPRVQAHELHRADVHHAQSPLRSVRLASDLAPHLERVDVVFTGSACAAPGAPTQALTVRLGLFDGARPILDKTLLARDPAGFQQMPLVYERAFGGMEHPDNPVGVGASPGSSAPSLVDPLDPKRAIGLGPIARSWLSRRRLLGSTPRNQLDGPIAEIPEGFDWSYFQVAPLDQRLDRLRGDEWLIMDGLHPERPRVRMRLPGARAFARVHGLSSAGLTEGHEIELTADTLHIDGDTRTCSMVWRRSFPLPEGATLASVRIAAGVALPGQPIAWPDPHEPSRRANGAPTIATFEATPPPPEATIYLIEGDVQLSGGTVFLPDDAAPSVPVGATVAFSPDSVPFPPSAYSPPLAAAPPRPPPIPGPAATLLAAPVIDEPALPFRAAAGPPPLPPRESAPVRTPPPATGTLFVPDDAPIAAKSSPLPFATASGAKAPPPELSLLPEPPIELSPPAPPPEPPSPPPKREVVWAPQPEAAAPAPPPRPAKAPRAPRLDVLKLLYGSNK